MSEEQLKAFLEAVKADAALSEKLKAATDVDAAVAIAKEAGFVISAEAFNSDKRLRLQLSDEDLESVAGGAETQNFTMATWCMNADGISNSCS